MFPLAIIAASMLAQHMANSDAQDRQAALQRSMQAYQQSKAKANEQTINSLVDKDTPDARAKELQDIDASRVASMTGTVDQARAASPVTQAAGTSADYQKAKAVATDTVAARTKRAIEQLGLMGAPGEQGVASSIRLGRAAGNVDANNSAIGNVGNAFMTDINNVRPDPFLMLASKVGMGVGTGMEANYLGSAVPDAEMNNGQGFEDASGNLYSDQAARQTRAQSILGDALGKMKVSKAATGGAF